MPNILDKLLHSDNDTDVLFSCDFVYKAYLMNISYAESYIHKILTLVFNESEKISQKIISIISSVYIYQKDCEKFQSSENIAKNLIKLSYNNNIQEKMSLEQLIRGLVKEENIGSKVIDCLFEIAIKSENTKNIIYSLNILYIISSEKPILIYSGKNIKKIEEITNYLLEIKKINCDTFDIGKYYCKLISNINNNVLNDDLVKSADSIIENLLFSNINMNVYYNEWFNFCETAISSLRDINAEPDKLYNKYIIRFSDRLIKGDKINSNYLSQLYHILGCIALNTFIYCDSIVRKLKLQNNRLSKTSQRKSKGNDEDDLMAMVGSHNENEIYDQILLTISNKSLLYDNLLSSYTPLLLKIIYNKDNKYNSINLQRSAVLCLCKFMVISENYCKENIQLLFTLLLHSPDITIKCNIIISLGDLVFRYPNVLEQYTSSIYSGLRDEVYFLLLFRMKELEEIH